MKRGVCLLLVALSLVLAPTASGLGIYQELPTDVEIGKNYEDVLVQVQGDSYDWEGPCKVSLFWATSEGSTIEGLTVKRNSDGCSWGQERGGKGATDFLLDFRVPESIADPGEEYNFGVQTTIMGDTGEKYTKTSRYAAFPVIPTSEKVGRLEVRSFVVEPRPLVVDEVFNVRLEIFNPLDNEIGANASLLIDGSQAQKSHIQVPAKDLETVRFQDENISTPGNHSLRITLGDDQKEFRSELTVQEASIIDGKAAPLAVPTALLLGLVAIGYRRD